MTPYLGGVVILDFRGQDLKEVQELVGRLIGEFGWQDEKGFVVIHDGPPGEHDHRRAVLRAAAGGEAKTSK